MQQDLQYYAGILSKITNHQIKYPANKNAIRYQSTTMHNIVSEVFFPMCYSLPV